MVDFWLGLGTLIADPRLEKAVKASKIGFKSIGIDVKWGDGKTARSASAGPFDARMTNAIQNLLAGFYAQHYPDWRIPVSPMSAAKLVQLISARYAPNGKRSWYQIAAIQRTKLLKAQGGKPVPFSRDFAMVLGLLMFDYEVRKLAAKGHWERLASVLFITLTKEQQAVLAKIAASFMHGAARAATVGGASLLAGEGGEGGSEDDDPGDGPTWDNGCCEVAFFYEGFERALR